MAAEQAPVADVAMTSGAPAQKAPRKLERVDSTPEVPKVVEIPLVKPEKPKKAVSAYWIYSNEARDKVAAEFKAKNENGKAQFGEVAKAVSARWHAMSADEKKPYEEKAAVDKARWEAEMVTYNALCNPAAALRAKYAELIPKRPASAYALFCQDSKQKEKATAALGEDVTSTSITKKLQDMWKEVTSDEKNQYQQESVKENLAFLEKQKVWQSTEAFAEIEKAEKIQEERKKALDAAVAQKEAEDKAKADRATRLARKQANKPAPEPKGITSPASAAKRPRTSNATSPASKASPKVLSPEIDAKVLEEAIKEGFEAGLKNLAARPEVLASGKTSRAILDALKTSGGLVNPAKRALLGQ